MRKCTRCSELKALTEYGIWNRAKDGLRAYCKECARGDNRRHQAENLEKRTNERRSHWIGRYGITEAQRDEMFETQNGLCAICKQNLARCIDHNHTTGAVRDLLCNNCNSGLGFFKEDTYRLTQAIKYLNKHEQSPRENKVSKVRSKRK